MKIKQLIGNWKLEIKNYRKGFTLIELLIVIAIIGVLATLLMVNFVGVRQRARDAQRKSDLRQLQSALEIYRSDNGSYPVVNSMSALGNCPAHTGSCVSSTACFGNPACSTVYMQNLPVDPSGAGYYNAGSYVYLGTSNGTYTLGACLENSGDSQGTHTNPSAATGCASVNYFVLNNP
jgi:type II secretion system protein G